MHKTLISYSRKDEAFVQELDAELRAAGIDVWIDTRSIMPGEPWRQVIFDAIPQVDSIVACISGNYLASEMCTSEAFLARCYHKRLLPLALGPVWGSLSESRATYGIRALQILPYYSGDLIGYPMDHDAMIARLVRDMQIPQVQQPDDLVYIVFPGQEAVLATRIADDLCDAGINTWISTRDSLIGFDWQEQQWQAMRKSRLMILILTPDSAASQSVRHQILFAMTRRLPMLPVVPASVKGAERDDLPRILNANYENRLVNEVHWLFEENNYAGLLTQLQEAARRVMEAGER